MNAGITFGEPNWLWGLCGPAVIALVLLVLIFVRRRAPAVRWPGIQRVIAAGDGLQPVPPRGGVRRPWLLLIALACVLFALARPRWGEIEEPVFQQAREVMIALDLSRSMLTPDVPPSRLERARLLMRTLLDGLHGERVGLVVFAGTSFVQVPLSADYQILGEFLPELKPDYMPQGGTDYTGMLRAAIGGFSDSGNTDRYLIVLSDGESTTDDWRNQLEDLRKRGVRVIALGVGTPAGAFIPDGKGGFIKDERGAVVLSRLEPATLQELASTTNGAYRDASAWIDLPGLLAETVERGRAGAFTEQRSVKHIERFQWFLVPAFVFALLGLWREIAVRPRLRAIRRRTEDSLTTAAVASAMLAIVLATAPHARAGVVRTDQPAGSAAGDTASTLRKTVSRVAGASQPRASDWRALAEQTLAYGNETRTAKKPVERGAILDALAAVDLGEKADPRTTDWTKLRNDLNALLEKPPEQNQDQQQQQQQQKKDQQQKQDQQQQQDGSDQQQQQQQSPQDKNQPQKSEPQDGQQKNESESQPQSDKPNEQQDKNSSSEQKPSQGGEMGDLKNEPKDAQAPQPAQPAQQNKTQKFGGRPADDATTPPTNPEDAAALQRLRQVGDQDSPAELYEMIEGKSKQAAQRGRDW